MKKRLSMMEKRNIEQRAKKVLIAFGYKLGEDIYVDAVQLARFLPFNKNIGKSFSGDVVLLS